jgi:hypothetical protein
VEFRINGERVQTVLPRADRARAPCGTRSRVSGPARPRTRSRARRWRPGRR